MADSLNSLTRDLFTRLVFVSCQPWRKFRFEGKCSIHSAALEWKRWCCSFPQKPFDETWPHLSIKNNAADWDKANPPRLGGLRHRRSELLRAWCCVGGCRGLHRCCCFPQGERRRKLTVEWSKHVTTHLTSLSPSRPPVPFVSPVFSSFSHSSWHKATGSTVLLLEGRMTIPAATAHTRVCTCSLRSELSITPFLFNLHGNAALSSPCPTLFSLSFFFFFICKLLVTLS